MTIAVPFEHTYDFTVAAAFDEVFDLLADVPNSASHFPKLAQLVDLGGNAYRWEMERVGTAQFNIQTIYASHYVSNRRQGSVRWTPLEDVGNARISGEWAIRRESGQKSQRGQRDHTHLTLLIRGELQVPLPGLMRRVVAPIIEAENHKLISRYVANLTERFNGTPASA